MSRYIDADAIKDKAWKAESEACFYALEDVVSVTDIDEAPSIDIVRCKECRHRKPSGYVGSVKTYKCDITGFKMHDITNHFCSYGEREGE